MQARAGLASSTQSLASCNLHPADLTPEGSLSTAIQQCARLSELATSMELLVVDGNDGDAGKEILTPLSKQVETRLLDHDRTRRDGS